MSAFGSVIVLIDRQRRLSGSVGTVRGPPAGGALPLAYLPLSLVVHHAAATHEALVG